MAPLRLMIPALFIPALTTPASTVAVWCRIAQWKSAEDLERPPAEIQAYRRFADNKVRYPRGGSWLAL